MIYILHPSANQITWSQSPNSRPLESSNHSPSFDTPPPKSDISQIFWPLRYTAMYWRDLKWTLSVPFLNSQWIFLYVHSFFFFVYRMIRIPYPPVLQRSNMTFFVCIYTQYLLLRAAIMHSFSNDYSFYFSV